jgi:hypothetical protein
LSGNAFNDTWQALGPSLVSALGDSGVELRRPSSLRGPSQVVPALTLQANALAGATTVVAVGTSIRGAIAPGALVTVGAAAPVACVSATTGVVAAGTVTITLAAPGLSDPVLAGASITFASYASFPGLRGLVTRRVDVSGGDVIPDFAFRVTVPFVGCPITPALNDVVVLDSGEVGRVAREPVAGSVVGFWDLDCGASV